MSKRFPTKEPEPMRAVMEQPPPKQQIPPKKKPKGTKAVPKPVEQKQPDTPPQTPEPRSKSKEQVKDNSTAKEEARKLSASDSGEANYDLRPTSSKPRSESLESLTEILFSEEYLRTLTSDPQLLTRFSSFLARYEPSIAPLVLKYVETQKVIKAVSYANAVAKTLPTKEEDTQPAASLSESFRKSSEYTFDTLLNVEVPTWVTYNLVKTSTSILFTEITNQSSYLTRDLVGGLSEVFCITDPNQKDNPIAYASEEFYRLTGYGRESVIGYNCRFLQGAKTRKESVKRLKDSIKKGEEICETLLNYRRDGKPFVNVLLLAPLRDDKGNLKYYLGAQVDVSKLIEGGRGVEGLERCLVRKDIEEKRKADSDKEGKQVVLEKLRDLSMAFDLEESAVVQSQSRQNSISKNDNEVSRKAPLRRRRLGGDDEKPVSDGEDSDDEKTSTSPKWTISQYNSTGKLPGIYKKYLLLRPHPSLCTIFVSQSARILGNLQQKRFLSCIAAPASTLSGLQECFQSGTPVTAKVAIMKTPGSSKEGSVTGKWNDKENGPGVYGAVCWVSATPLMDGEERVGVWMVVIVDKGSAAASHVGRRLERLQHIENAVAADPRAEEEDAPAKSKPTQEEQEEQGDVESPSRDGGSSTLVLGLELKAPDPTERSASSALLPEPETEQNANSTTQIESRYGSLNIQSPFEEHASQSQMFLQVEDHHIGEESREVEDMDGDASDTTPTKLNGVGRGSRSRSGGARPQNVGLRAMDYLTAKTQAKSGGGEDGELGMASPYSVD